MKQPKESEAISLTPRLRRGRTMRAALWTGWSVAVSAVAVASLLPHTAPPAYFHADKLIHLAVYALLATIPGALVRRVSTAIAICVLLAVMGTGLEVAQAQLPDRVGSGADAAMNLIGVSVGWLLGRRWRHTLPDG